MCSLLKTIATQSYSLSRIVACAGQSQFILKCIENRSSCYSTAAAAATTTTTFALVAASKQRQRIERDNTTILADQGHTTKNYQTYSRLALTTTTTATADRPVYSLASHFGKELVNGKHSTRHNRLYCTKQSTKKKMASIFTELFEKYSQKLWTESNRRE